MYRYTIVTFEIFFPKMHYLIWLLGALAMLSCTARPSPHETEMKQRVIVEKAQQNARIFREIMEEGPKSGNKKVISAVQDTKRVMSWRERYQRNRNAQNLLVYSDSISQAYSKLAAHDRKILAGMRSYHNSIGTTTNDSSKVFDLELYVLFAESALLDDLLNRMGYTNHHYTYAFPSNLNDTLFNAGDTVLMLVDTFSDDVTVDFKSVKCVNQQTQRRIDPQVIKLGPSHLLKYLPKVKGTYVVSGPVYYANEYYSSDLPVFSKFRVR
jgi:hypothetical protein